MSIYEHHWFIFNYLTENEELRGYVIVIKNVNASGWFLVKQACKWDASLFRLYEGGSTPHWIHSGRTWYKTGAAVMFKFLVLAGLLAISLAKNVEYKECMSKYEHNTEK